jgi:hypothetical protein
MAQLLLHRIATLLLELLRGRRPLFASTSWLSGANNKEQEAPPAKSASCFAWPRLSARAQHILFVVKARSAEKIAIVVRWRVSNGQTTSADIAIKNSLKCIALAEIAVFMVMAARVRRHGLASRRPAE